MSQHTILSLALPLAEVLLAWLGLWILFGGVGYGMLRAVCPGHPEGMAAGVAPWLGYAGAVLLLQLWHLFLAIDWRALATLSALSLAGWLTTLGTRNRPDRPRLPLAARILVAVALLWLADRAIGPFMSYDGANYHLQTIRWNHEYAAVPGLADLNPNYGLAGSSLLVPALLECGALQGRGQHFVLSFLIALLFVQVCAGVARILNGRAPTASHAAALVLLFPLVVQLDDDAVATYNTDVAVSVVIYAAILLACADLGRAAPTTGETRPGISPELFAAFSLLAVAPCLKATCGVFAAATWLGLALVVVFADRPSAVRRLLPAVVVALCAAVPWLIRNAILTGYPLYPLPLGALQADWRLPRHHLDGQLWFTQSYMRTPGAWELMVEQRGFNWLPYWLWFELRTAVFEILIPIALVLILAGIWLVARKRLMRQRATAGYLLYPVALAIAAWFLVAPAVRFGRFMFWSAAALLAAAVLPAPLQALQRRRRAAALLMTAWVLGPLLLQTYFVVKHRQGGGALAAVRDRFIVRPGPDHGLHPLLQVAMRSVGSCNGLVVHRPDAPDSLRDSAR
ncbi:MAG TPA: hypothetical protein VN999_07065, partial [Thermoanaerobaculia bacterium]|nr:hypothetical protein [Thermoanaerobaculia bacterium]